MSFSKEQKAAFRPFRMGLVVIIGLFAVAFAAARQAQLQEVKHQSETETHVTWKGDGGESVEVKARNVELTEDGSDLKSIAQDGYLYIDEARGGAKRHLKVVQGADGKLQYALSVNGKASSFDASAQKWLSKILVQFLRQSGRTSETRVRP